MAVDISQLGTFTWADLQTAAMHAMVSAAVGGGELTINGRTIRRISIKDAQLLYDLATAQIEAEVATADDGGGMVLVQYGERY